MNGDGLMNARFSIFLNSDSSIRDIQTLQLLLTSS